MENIEIRQKMLANGIKSYILAQAVGVVPSTLSFWLAIELTPERKERVEKALDSLIKKSRH